MLERNKPLTVAAHLSPEAELVSAAALVQSFLAFLRRQSSIIFFVLLTTIVLGAVYLFTTPPSYTAQATMIIDTRKVQLLQQQSILGDVAVDSAQVDSQVEILKSENVALSVIKELHLTEDQEFMSATGGLLGALVSFVASLFSSDEPKSEDALLRQAVERLEKGLTIKRVGLTYIINIDFRSPNPKSAAQIANAIADAYITDQLEAKYQATRRASVWLQERIRELRQQASAAERTVVEFKTKNNIVETGGRLMNEQALAETNSSLALARAQTAEARAKLDRIEEITRTGTGIPDGTVTDTLKNDVITRLRQQYLDISNREADWARRYTSSHLAVVHLRNQMAEIRRAISDELRRIAQTFRSDYEIAKAREDSIQQTLSSIVAQSQDTNQAQIALRELESSAQTYRALHDNFLQRYMEAVQQQSFPITEARLITQASPPLKKSHPKTLIVVTLSLAAGAVLGLGIGLFRDISERVFRTSSQVETTLQTSCIAIVPLVNLTNLKQAKSSITLTNPFSAERTIAAKDSILSYAIGAPFSRFTEAIRSIKVAIDLATVGKPIKVIGVTSSLPNEGKTTIATALAELIAQSGARTLLVDCDLRNPSLTRVLSPTARQGLFEVLSGVTPLADVVWNDAQTNLIFLPWVMKTRMPHTSDLLSAEKTKTLFESLRNQYDYVVVDLSPLSPVVDVRATSKFIDSYLFVAEWGQTQVEVVEHALNSAGNVYDNLLGVVLNKADTTLLGRYEGHRSKYYYNRYYSRYGYTD